MAWVVYFWAVAALWLLPLPFKIAGYVSGKDDSPRAVKIEEMANLVFFLVGLAGLYSYVYHIDLLPPLFWRAWIALAFAVTIAGLIWSPKIRYAAQVMGKSRVRVAIAISFIALGPMLVGGW